MFCGNCGQILKEGAAFCPKCGAAQKGKMEPVSAPAPESDNEVEETPNNAGLTIVVLLLFLINFVWSATIVYMLMHSNIFATIFK